MDDLKTLVIMQTIVITLFLIVSIIAIIFLIRILVKFNKIAKDIGEITDTAKKTVNKAHDVAEAIEKLVNPAVLVKMIVTYINKIRAKKTSK